MGKFNRSCTGKREEDGGKCHPCVVSVHQMLVREKWKIKLGRSLQWLIILDMEIMLRLEHKI